MARMKIMAVAAGVASLLLVTAPALAQDEGTEMADGSSVEVVGVEYAFVGLPTSLPAGTEVTFRNDGVELHEIAIAHIPESTTESIEELLAMGEEAIASGKVQLVGEGQLFVGPGGTAEGSLQLTTEGRHIALCFVPQGMDPAVFEAAGFPIEELDPEADPATLPAEIQAIMGNPPHLAAGMIQEFTVTAAGTEPGPLPEPMEAEAG